MKNFGYTYMISRLSILSAQLRRSQGATPPQGIVLNKYWKILGCLPPI